jgi:hypothetical protein
MTYQRSEADLRADNTEVEDPRSNVRRLVPRTQPNEKSTPISGGQRRSTDDGEDDDPGPVAA